MITMIVVAMSLGNAMVVASAHQVVSESDRAHDIRITELVERAAARLEVIPWMFAGRNEVVLTYRFDGVPNMRIQAPMDLERECVASAWFVPERASVTYDQLVELYEFKPDLLAEDAVQMLIEERQTRTISCNGRLATLLRMASEIYADLNPANIPQAATYTDSALYSVDFQMGDISLKVTFPAGLDHAIVEWADQVRTAALTELDMRARVVPVEELTQ